MDVLAPPLCGQELLRRPLAGVEFLAVDTETNGLGGELCELTEVGAVLVGGGEVHDRWSSLVRCMMPLRRGIQRLTGITQAMVDNAPAAEQVLHELESRLRGRVMVAHNAPFDRRVLRQAFERAGRPWPEPPVLCTAALARVLMPLQRERRLAVVAEALGIEMQTVHRALADAETCGRVLCALFGRLCANAATVAEALALQRPSRSRTRAAGRQSRPRWPSGSRDRLDLKGFGDPSPGLEFGSLPALGVGSLPTLDFGSLPRDPGVYLFRDGAGKALYVGKSLCIKSRARSHFAPAALSRPCDPARPDWRAHAAVLDYQATNSELGALVLENRLIKQLRPPGNIALARSDDRLVYIRCRLDIAFPILEVADEPASGHAVSVGPLRSRRLARELVEQLDSLFGLRHCGRRLPVRVYPSAYGQMGRCLSPCLGDLDPNLYRRRLDGALALFVKATDARQALLEHIEAQMRAAASAQNFERAIWLRRRAARVRSIFQGLGGVLEATHARPRVVIDSHPTASRHDAFWLVGGRLVDWGAVADAAELQERTRMALARGARTGELGAHVPPSEVDEVRIVASYLASHVEVRRVELDCGSVEGQLQSLAAELEI